MRQVITSIFKAICSDRVAAADGKYSVSPSTVSRMAILTSEQMRHVAGGDDTLPKGGWKQA